MVILLTSKIKGTKEKPELSKKLSATYVDFNTLLQHSDFVTAHCPLNEQTKNLFNKTTFQKMKSTAVFVNTTRYIQFEFSMNFPLLMLITNC